MENKKELRKRIRELFVHEWVWRLFIVLQAIGIIGLIYIDVTNSHWSVFPDFTDSRGRFDFDWEFFRKWHWTCYHTNWYVIAFLLGPFAISKSVDWISASRK